MNQYEDRQLKIQVCKLTSKLQYLVGIVNVFTDGYADVSFNKQFDHIRFEFAKTKKDYETRYLDIRGKIIEESIYLYFNEKDLPDWKLKDQKKILGKLKAAIKALEEFIQNPKEFDFEKEFYWYTETVKYKVYELEYENS